MGTVGCMLAPTLLHPGETIAGSTFTGTPAQAQIEFGLVGLVTIFGLGTILSGLWQIATGGRNRWIAIVMLGLIALLVIAGEAVRSALGS
jgi:hypothetical protein